MNKSVLFWKFARNAGLLLALVFCIFIPENVLAANKNQTPYGKYSLLFNQPSAFSRQLLSSQYLDVLKPYKKGFDESLKTGVTLEILAKTLTKSNLTFNDLENLFKKQETANPICFSQGGAYSFPPGRSFSTPLCWDTYKSGCRSCACQCGYVGYIWDPTTSICGCAQ